MFALPAEKKWQIYCSKKKVRDVCVLPQLSTSLPCPREGGHVGGEATILCALCAE